jgi:hypothetical protein
MNDIDEEVVSRIPLLLAIWGLENNENIEKENINITNFDFISKDFDIFYQDIKFDLIIGNPPYLSLEKGFLKEDIEEYKKEFESIFKVYDIFGIFIEKSLRFLNTNGNLCYIVPSTLFTNDSFEKLRKLMIKYNIKDCLFLGDKVFDNAVVPACIFNIENSKQESINIEFGDSEKLIVSLSEILGDKSSFRIGIDYEFNKEIINYQKNENNTTLGDLLDIKEAIKTGNDKRFIHEEKADNLIRLVKGKHVKPLVINQKLYLDYNTKEINRPLSPEFFEKDKIFIRRVSNKIIAAFDDTNLYATHTLYCAFDKNNELTKEDYKLLEIILNSEFYTKMYVTLFPFKGNIFPEIRPTKLKQLIFPKMEKIRENSIEINNCVSNLKIDQLLLSNIIISML